MLDVVDIPIRCDLSIVNVYIHVSAIVRSPSPGAASMPPACFPVVVVLPVHEGQAKLRVEAACMHGLSDESSINE